MSIFLRGFLRHSLDNDHLRCRGRLTQSFRFSIFFRVPPFLRSLHRRELNHDKTLGRPAAFEVFNLATANQKASTVSGEGFNQYASDKSAGLSSRAANALATPVESGPLEIKSNVQLIVEIEG